MTRGADVATGDVAVGVDIGGTKIAAAAVDAHGEVVVRVQTVTPHRSTAAAEVEDCLVSVVEDVTARVAPAVVRAVGIGAAGFVTADRSTVAFAPHLSWRDEPLRDALLQRLQVPVVVDNDATAAAWAEWRYGAGRGESRLVVVNLGTGIGGGIVVDGRLDRGRYGFAGEFGHMLVVPDGIRCECGNRGCWEQYASGRALVREARSMLAARSPHTAGLAARVAEDPDGLTGALISRAASGGDRAAIELLADVGRWLGIGLANLAAAFDPGRFVVGGGVSLAGDLLLRPAREAFARQLPGRGHRPEAAIVAAGLGTDAGVVGAAALAWAETTSAGRAGDAG